MPLRTVTIDPLGDPRWQRFVETSEQATVFHHVQWLALLHAQYGYPIYALCVVDAAGRVVAGVPLAHVRSRLTGRRLVALPFSDHCPILVQGDRGGEALELLAASLQRRHREHGLAVEVRGELPGLPVGSRSFYHHRICLSGGYEGVASGFRQNMRRDIRRAHRDGVVVELGRGRADLDAFYDLHLRTRRRQGVPTQPRRFIRRFEQLFDSGLGFVLVARHTGVPVAAAVYLQWGSTLTYKYGASATDHLRVRPNHAVFEESIRWSCEQGLTTLDLGRTDLDNEGLRSFKLGWGAEEQMLTYSSLAGRSLHQGGTLASLAHAVITRTPPITGRVAGLTLYRHFG